ncbi:MAG: hypothetical protein JOZ16_14825 [Methylobacteriaceae bacterium]|nr:hypothetical protein [Methylobacteriaceae bacterium]
MTIMSTITPDWLVLREEITTQALAACKKVEMAIGSASAPPPLELGEALEDVANEYLNLFEEISALHRSAHRGEASR